MSDFAPLFFVVALAVGCAGIGVETDFEPGTDFSTAKTWAFAPDGASLGEGTDERLRGAVRDSLAAKGFREAPQDADFFVRYDAFLDGGGVRQGADTSSRPSWASGGSNRANLTPTQGDLLISFIDPATGKALWTGRASATVAGDAAPVERAAQLQEAVRLVLAEFPPS